MGHEAAVTGQPRHDVPAEEKKVYWNQAGHLSLRIARNHRRRVQSPLARPRRRMGRLQRGSEPQPTLRLEYGHDPPARPALGRAVREPRHGPDGAFRHRRARRHSQPSAAGDGQRDLRQAPRAQAALRSNSLPGHRAIEPRRGLSSTPNCPWAPAARTPASSSTSNPHDRTPRPCAGPTWPSWVESARDGAIWIRSRALGLLRSLRGVRVRQRRAHC